MATVSLVRKALLAIKDYWYVPLLVLGVIIGYYTFRRWRGTEGDALLKPVLDTIRVIQAGGQARNEQIQNGVEAATASVKAKYQVQQLALQTEQANQVKELENDPIALAKYLERITR